MRRFVVYAAALCMLLSTVVVAQRKVSTAKELDALMKRAGAFRRVDRAIQTKNPAQARSELATVFQAVADSQSFWIEHKKDDAVKLNKESLAKLQALDKLLTNQASFDVAAATAAFKEAGGACRACHQQYRVEDANNEYALKPGSVPGVSE
jgi:cytochrome c556